MKVTGIDIYHFRLPFVSPMKVGGEVLHDREGVLLMLTDNAGRRGAGEIAPLPGLDRTTLEQCLQELPSVRGALGNAPLHHDRFQLTLPLLGLMDITSPVWTPQTLFGVESALLGLHLQYRGMSPAATSPLPAEPLRIPVNGLFIPESTADCLDAQIRNLKNGGAATLKIKIGRLPVDEEIRQIRLLVDKLGTGISLRLDGNRNLTPAVYRHYYEALRHFPVEYVEEPLPEAEPAAEAVPWPLALDESLALFLDPESPQLSDLDPRIRAVILKPGLLKGLHGMARGVREAERVGIRTVLSSAFNTGLTLTTLGVFSRLAGIPPETAHGLDTLRYLADDLLRPPPAIHRGMLVIPGELLLGGWALNENVIREKFP